MRKRKTMKQLVLVTLLALTAGCSSNADNKETAKKDEPRLPQLRWMIGRWENNSDQGNLSEIWKQSNDSTYSGESYFVIQGDTVFAESVQLAERGGKITYCVTIPGQNNDEEVCFELTKLEKNRLQFENPKHDYPRVIIYQQKGDSLLAEISGEVKGERKSEQFRMKKN